MVASLATALGFDTDASLLIIHCDDLGMTHAANVSVYNALRHHRASSATLMVPAPWARDAAAMYRGEDVGVHLTCTAEWDAYRWGPLTYAPSLLDGSGGFPQTNDDLWDHGDLDELRRECRAQIERAIVWGFDVTHLDAHMHALLLRPEFFDVALELAVDYDLPMRLPPAAFEARAGFPLRELAAREGILVADRTIDGGDDLGATLRALCASPLPGVTDLAVSPAEESPEVRAACTDADQRIAHGAFLDSADGLNAALADAGITVIDYRQVRAAQRAAR